jgi:AcrR family transcriptional regulator
MSGEDTSQRILQEAGPIFAEKGFRRATVREICRAAGVNLASVNYYFRDKERLYIEAVKLAHQMRTRQVPLPQWPAGTSATTKLREFIETMMARMVGLEEAPWQTRLMLREILQPTTACKELVEDYFRPHFDLLLGILHEMLPAEMPVHRRRQIGFSIIGQCVYYRVARDVVSILVPRDELAGHYTVAKLADHIVEFSLAALGRRPPLGDGAAERTSSARAAATASIERVGIDAGPK